MMSKHKISHVRMILISIFSVLVLIVIGGLGYGYVSLLSVGDGNKEYELTIEQGEPISNVLETLQNEGMIKNKTMALMYNRFFAKADYKQGVYDVNDGMSVEKILAYISDASNAKSNYYELTIPEGTWAKEVAQKISDLYGWSTDEIISYWNDDQTIDQLASKYSFIDSAALNNPEYKVKLEGYLFPQTYYMDPNFTLEEVTDMILQEMNTFYQEHKAQIESSSYSFHDLITLASVVQFEAGNTSDMAKISGVFNNRINQAMPLQSSVTVCYALYDDFSDPKDCEVNYDIDSSYNTYLHEGLPVGPILNPGSDALLATLNPEKTDYLFFVADIHGDGKVYYSKTYEEHQQLMEQLGLFIE